MDEETPQCLVHFILGWGPHQVSEGKNMRNWPNKDRIGGNAEGATGCGWSTEDTGQKPRVWPGPERQGNRPGTRSHKVIQKINFFS